MKNLLILSLVAVAAFSNATDYVVNGNFTNNPGFGGGSWSFFYNTSTGQNPVVGWYSQDNSIPIELGEASVYGVTPVDGNTSEILMELDSTQNATISQNVTDVNAKLQLSFDYAARAGTSPAQNNFEVLWNNTVVATVDPTSTTMTTIAPITVQGTGSDLLTFESLSDNSSLGGELMNVHVESVPEPFSMVTLGLGVVGLLKRKKK